MPHLEQVTNVKQATPFTNPVAKAWDEYLALRRKAETSGRLEDGIAAARAYWRFYHLFVPREEQASA